MWLWCLVGSVLWQHSVAVSLRLIWVVVICVFVVAYLAGCACLVYAAFAFLGVAVLSLCWLLVYLLCWVIYAGW